MDIQNNLVQQGEEYSFIVPYDWAGARVDTFLAHCFSQYTRSFLQKLFKLQCVTLASGTMLKAGNTLKQGDEIRVIFPKQERITPSKDINQVAVEIIAEEHDFFIINKPAGLVVHPPHTKYESVALTDWITHAYEDIAHVGAVDRPGIVHRLDKDTSGLMIIPRTNEAHAVLSDMFKNRQIHKTYRALVLGHPPVEGKIEFFIGRHPHMRHMMHAFTELTRLPSSRDAVSYFKVLTYFEQYTLLEIKPVTGRTHQIRVHCAASGFPVLADEMYGKSSKLLKRHALHAYELAFEYKGVSYSYTSPMSQDMQSVINALPELSREA